MRRDLHFSNIYYVSCLLHHFGSLNMKEIQMLLYREYNKITTYDTVKKVVRFLERCKLVTTETKGREKVVYPTDKLGFICVLFAGGMDED